MRRNVKPGMPPVVAGLIALALAAILVSYVFGVRLPADHFELRATFRDAHDIKKHSPVRIAGVPVGEVVAVRPVAGGTSSAQVTFRVSDKGLPIHRDARISIRPRIFLEGNFFLDLQPGSASSPALRDGETIPIGQTSSLVTFGDVTSALRIDTRRSLQGLLHELDVSLAGAGARGFNRSLPYWAPAYRDSAIVADALRGSAGDLPAYLRDGGTVAAAADRDPQALRGLITGLRTTATAFARESGALDSALREVPGVVRDARPALAAVDGALPATRRLAREARPGIRRVAPALAASVPLVRELAGLLSPSEVGGVVRDLRPTVPQLAGVLRDGLPLLHEARSLASCQNAVVLPTLKGKVEDRQFPASGPVYEEFAKALPGLAGESRSGDANGQWIRALFTGGNYAYPAPAGQLLLTSRPIAGANPGLPARGVPPFRPDVPCETQEPPDLRSDPAPAPSGFRVDQTSSAARAITGRGLGVAQRFLRRSTRGTSLDGRLKLRDTPLRRSELARSLGRLP